MLGEKVCTVTLDVDDPVGFASSADAQVLARLRRDYERRCLLGAMIVRVLAVLRRSAIRVPPAGPATVDVQFRARALVLSLGDLLAPVEILRVTPMVVGQVTWRAPAGSDDATVPVSVSFLSSRGIEALAVGHRVAARVIQADAPPGRDTYTAVVGLLCADAATRVFRLRGALSAEDGALLAPLVADIEAELKVRASLGPTQKEALWFIEGVYSAKSRTGEPAARAGKGSAGAAAEAKARPEAACAAWTGPLGADRAGPQSGPADAEARDLLALVREAKAGGAAVAGLWFRPPGLYRSAPVALFAPESKQADGLQPVDARASLVFADLLRETLGFLQATREMAAVFEDLGLRDKHEGLWSALCAPAPK